MFIQLYLHELRQYSFMECSLDVISSSTNKVLVQLIVKLISVLWLYFCLTSCSCCVTLALGAFANSASGVALGLFVSVDCEASFCTFFLL